MLYPISTKPFFGQPLKPAFPTNPRGSRRLQNHRFQPTGPGSAFCCEAKKLCWECSSFKGGRPASGLGTLSSSVKAERSLVSACASSTVAATSSVRVVNSWRPCRDWGVRDSRLLLKDGGPSCQGRPALCCHRFSRLQGPQKIQHVLYVLLLRGGAVQHGVEGGNDLIGL